MMFFVFLILFLFLVFTSRPSGAPPKLGGAGGFASVLSPPPSLGGGRGVVAGWERVGGLGGVDTRIRRCLCLLF